MKRLLHFVLRPFCTACKEDAEQRVRAIVREEVAAAVNRTRAAMAYTDVQTSGVAEQIHAARDYMKRTYGKDSK